MTTIDQRPRSQAFWTDARFLLGIALIIGSIAGVWAVVAAARQTAPVLVAARTIAAGEEIGDADVRVADVALGPLARTYLAPGAISPGAVALRTLEEGELVAGAALGPAAGLRSTTVAVRLDDSVPAAVAPGSSVEVWVAEPGRDGGFDDPRVLISEASVLSVSRAESVMGSAGTSLELMISRSDVGGVLAALADDARLSVVPAGPR